MRLIKFSRTIVISIALIRLTYVRLYVFELSVRMSHFCLFQQTSFKVSETHLTNLYLNLVDVMLKCSEGKNIRSLKLTAPLKRALNSGSDPIIINFEFA